MTYNFREAQDFKARAGIEYFEERKLEMLHLRHDEKWTIEKISILFGVSRERVRQIIGNTGNIGENNFSPARARSVVTNIEVAEKYAHLNNTQVKELGYTSADMAYRGKTRHVSESKQATEGGKIEEWVSAELTKRGMVNTLTNSRPFDIILADGKTIEVKARFKTNEGCNSFGWKDYYFFVLNRMKYKKPAPMADYYVAVIVRDGKKYPFVLRQADVPPSGVIGFRWSAKSKWRKFENRFDLIR